MADQRTIDIFHEALNFGLQRLGAGDLKLKENNMKFLSLWLLITKMCGQFCQVATANR